MTKSSFQCNRNTPQMANKVKPVTGQLEGKAQKVDFVVDIHWTVFRPGRSASCHDLKGQGQWLETFLTVSPSRGATGWMNFRFHEGTLSKVLDLFLCNREKVFAGSSVKISMVLQGKASTRFSYVKSKKHLEKWQSEFSMTSAQAFDLQPFTMN